MDMTTALALRSAKSIEVFCDGDATFVWVDWKAWEASCFAENRTVPPVEFKALPEEKLDWRPAPSVRSFRELFLHIAYGNNLLLWLATDNPPADLFNQRVLDQQKKSWSR